jgi:hypothetical protein
MFVCKYQTTPYEENCHDCDGTRECMIPPTISCEIEPLPSTEAIVLNRKQRRLLLRKKAK